MKKSICLLLVLLVALVPILVSATNNDDVETITLIKYDCVTGLETPIDIEVDESDLTAPMPVLGANPNLSRQIINGNKDGISEYTQTLREYKTVFFTTPGNKIIQNRQNTEINKLI